MLILLVYQVNTFVGLISCFSHADDSTGLSGKMPLSVWYLVLHMMMILVVYHVNTVVGLISCIPHENDSTGVSGKYFCRFHIFCFTR